MCFEFSIVRLANQGQPITIILKLSHTHFLMEAVYLRILFADYIRKDTNQFGALFAFKINVKFI